MRIIQVVTLITPDGAYGGPTRVAVNQVRQLRAEGHDAILVAAHRGFGDDVPTEFDGVPVRLFPARTAIPGAGFAGLSSPEMRRFIRTQLPTTDVLHLHLARDLVTLPIARLARRAKTPYVAQPHGMIDRSSNPLAIPLDAVLTRPALHGASSVFYLTDREREDLTGIGGGRFALESLQNGVPLPDAIPLPSGDEPEVLFLARLQERKRPLAFVAMARALADRFPRARFSLVGPDEGEGDAVSRAIAESGSDRIAWEGPIPPEQTLERIARSSLFVLPSVNEPFPMAVLEAMSLGRPVVVTDTCGLAPIIQRDGAGAVIDASIDALTESVAALLSDDGARIAAGQNARRSAVDNFRMDAVSAVLGDAYERARKTASTRVDRRGTENDG